MNRDMRIPQKDSDEIERDFYVSGWLGTGLMRVILTTMNVSFGVVTTEVDTLFLKPLEKAREFPTV